MPDDSTCRPSPEQLLEKIEEQERKARRGRLKIFLGYTSGVGKSFQMLDEGRRRRERNWEDVVVTATQPQYPPEVKRLLVNHEIIPPLKINDQEVINVAAVLERRPQVVLIDGLAYDNPPGSRNAKRWQDVEEILGAGISVIASVNVEYIEECRAEVEHLTGKRRLHALPRHFLEKADDIVIVDAPAENSRGSGRSDSVAGEPLPLERQKLMRLREMALLVAAEVVDRQLESYLKTHGIDQLWGVQERILVCVTPRSNAAQIIESARRNADRFHGQLFAVYVRDTPLSPEEEKMLLKNLDRARELGAETEVLAGEDMVDAIVGFAREKGITQILIGHSRREGRWQRLQRSKVDRLIRKAEGIDISIYPQVTR